ncbi:hypothetical protein BKA63DRAFT_524148 [Paraphoma chrysanthemicola]|nr:hypothetical protein BKA63DRAFT_524148 [Paraphoma chrysanthemicola]
MQHFTDDDRQFDVYTSLAQSRRSDGPWSSAQTVEVIEWPPVGNSSNPRVGQVRQVQIQRLFQDQQPRLRVIFAPPDGPSAGTVDVVSALLQHYKAPPAFLMERLQSVAHSCGSRVANGNNYASWFHFLCKDLAVYTNQNGETRIENTRPTAAILSQADGTWIKSGFFLTWGPGRNNEICTTLVCFGAHTDIKERFESLAYNSSWLDAVHSPFNLFVILLEQLFLTLDSKIWDLSDVFRTLEGEILLQATSQCERPETQFDFVALHNVTKYIAYLMEAANAMLLVVDDIQIQSRSMPCDMDAGLVKQVVASLAYQKGLFRSENLRLKSLDKRMQNIINLAFNLVTQQDSHVMKRDSDSMKTIAAVTLLFLPMSTIATIFGSQFFNSESGVLHIADNFWLYWIIALPTTIIVIGSWYLYHRCVSQHRQKGRRTSSSYTKRVKGHD